MSRGSPPTCNFIFAADHFRLPPRPTVELVVVRLVAKMPGSSRMPVSLRNTLATKRTSNGALLAFLNIELYVCPVIERCAVLY